MKQAIVNFIRNGKYTGTKYGPEDFIKKLPFLEFIISEQPSVMVGMRDNDNWFWRFGNYHIKSKLADDIAKVKKFAPGDVMYDHILDRFENKDGYGINRPVPRETKEQIDQKQYEEACKHYGVFSQSRTYEELAYKLIYCKDRGCVLDEAKAWNILEKILCKPLTFEEYTRVNELIYGDPEELLALGTYCTNSYFELVRNMESALEAFRGSVPYLAEGYTALIVSEHKAGRLDVALYNWHKLYDLFEAPEGSSPKTRADLFAKQQEYMQQIPDQVVYDVTDYGKAQALKGVN
ncbi:MAG: hypothetical protein UGF89_12805 [Acutalibacteraceae bacterium]|nr:hypothetical protein [Acutalibacteraceae bacterium]